MFSKQSNLFCIHPEWFGYASLHKVLTVSTSARLDGRDDKLIIPILKVV
ncbi:hypothetical protein HNO89_004394 [Sporosarcina luteola]|nr:hypothetical protein [Sporosarcina luteola]